MQCQHKNKECEEVDPSSSVGEIVDTEQEEFQPAKKMLRFSSFETTSSAVNQEIRTCCRTYVLFAREKSRILLSR